MAEQHVEFACRSCGGKSFKAWYPVDESQGVEILGVDEDGKLEIEYDGCTEYGESGEDTEYWCRECDEHAETLEELIGLPAPAKPFDPNEVIVVVQRHPDYSDDILTFGGKPRVIYIDLGSSFDVTHIRESEYHDVAEFLKGLRQEVEDLPVDHGARVFVEETVTTILDDHPEMKELVV